MCGIVGIVGNQNVAGQLYDGLTVLQHRGQDAAGIATADGSRLRLHKANGLVRDVFDAKAMSVLEGRVGIAHCRYPTAGSEGQDGAAVQGHAGSPQAAPSRKRRQAGLSVSST